MLNSVIGNTARRRCILLLSGPIAVKQACAQDKSTAFALLRKVVCRHSSGSNRATSSTIAPPVVIFDLPGYTPYITAWRWQQELVRKRREIAKDVANDADPATRLADVLFVLEHPHVYTLGRNASSEHLLFDASSSDIGAEVHRVERGGKVTYHGPGQLVVYPILQLARHQRDLHWYVHTIENVIIASLADFEIAATRMKGYPGVWVGDRKIAQVGMMCSQWVTSHGFAINVEPDMSFFKHIVPCGIEDRAVTSMALELGAARVPTIPAVRAVVARHFALEFDVDLVASTCDNPLELDGK